MKKVLFLLFLIMSVSILYADEVKLFNKLPVIYIGTFKWENSETFQHVKFIWESQEMKEKGNILLKGKGVYIVNNRKTNIKIKGVVNPKTYRIEIWEYEPDSKNFITDGSHIGKISPDLKTIEAVWTTNNTGKRGRLKLIKREKE